MKYALVKNNVVENIIEYDPEAIEVSNAEYEQKKADYKAGKKKYATDLAKYKKDYGRALKLARAEAIRLKAEKGAQKSYIVPIEEIKPPEPLIKPRRPSGLYHPPSGYELVLLAKDDTVNINDLLNKETN